MISRMFQGMMQGGGKAGLLGDPLFQVGMGLLAKGQDNRIPYATAVMGGLQGAQTAQDQSTQRQLLQEQARRAEAQREAYKKAVAQLYPNTPGDMAAQPVPSQVAPGMEMQMMGPPTPPTPNPMAGLLTALGPEAGSTALVDGLLAKRDGFDIQAPSPKDFTAESVAEYQRTGDASVLVRKPLTEIVTNADNTRTLIDYSDPTQVRKYDITTPQDIADRAAEFKRIERDDPEYKASVSNLVNVSNKLLTEDLSNILGYFDNLSPTIREGSAGLEADLNLVLANMELFDVGKLKGQGTVTDGERQILRNATTVLSNRSISEAKAKQALQDIVDILGRKLNPADQPSNKQGGNGSVLVSGGED